MTLVDIIFNYGGEWIKNLNIMYSHKLIDTWTSYDPNLLSFIDIANEYTSKFGYLGVQQLMLLFPLLVSEEFKVLNIYVVDQGEESLEDHNISQHFESYVPTIDVGTNCESDNESGKTPQNLEKKEKKFWGCRLCLWVPSTDGRSFHGS
ncbi:hypothetical protein MTR67_026600 [Solanum verrucosum]|uniref:Uncharacterized protein n=1 Tax=Solanum verrucosum TaxID=315347 RepID=A0AAF0R2K2_SOLVR|nr:hypothetical protein MTR67_026600 [Solanum verrucosum]